MSNTWRNPVNAAFKKRKLYFNILPKLERSPGLLYKLSVPPDDWSPLLHKALTRRISRAKKSLDWDAGYLWVDNFMSAGVMVYLTDTPIPDFEIVNLEDLC